MPKPWSLLLLCSLLAACGGGSSGGATSLNAVPSGPQLISQAVVPGSFGSAGSALRPDISGDGAVMACMDHSADTVPDDMNRASDVLVSYRDGRPALHISRAPDGAPGNGSSSEPALDQDGSHCAFWSAASNLVANDVNGFGDVFVRDIEAGTTRLVSVNSSGEQGDEDSLPDLAISADGQIVVFTSVASNLVPGDTNGRIDVFAHDCGTGITTRVSVDSAGAQALGGHSTGPDVSADGRYVVFQSRAANLAPGDTNGRTDVFLHDRTTGITSRVSVSEAGAEADHHCYDPRISGNGAVVVFHSRATNLLATGPDNNGQDDVLVHVVATGAIEKVSVDSSGIPGNDDSRYADIDATGRVICFESDANNLVPGDTNNDDDVFCHDRQTGITTRINTTPVGGQALSGAGDYVAVSDDGTQFVFTQSDGGLTPDGRGQPSRRNMIHKDLNSGAVVVGTRSLRRDEADGDSGTADGGVSVSRSGRWIVFVSKAGNLVPGDENNLGDLFRHDVLSGETTRMLEHPGEGVLDAFSELTVSDDGRFVCFLSRNDALLGTGNDTNRVADVFVYDVERGVTERVSVNTDGTPTDAPAELPRMSRDGRFVVFESRGPALADSKTGYNPEIFLHDRDAGTTKRVVIDDQGRLSGASCYRPDLSHDGRFITFETGAALVADDTNGVSDIYVRDMQGGIRRVSVDSAGAQATGDSGDARISGDGRFIAFNSLADDLVANDTNGRPDIFRHDLQTGETLRVNVDRAGAEAADGESSQPAISSDGAYVLFHTRATNLTSAPISEDGGLLLHHVPSGETRIIALHPDGGAPQTSIQVRTAALGDAGRLVVYAYASPQRTEVFWIRSEDGLD